MVIMATRRPLSGRTRVPRVSPRRRPAARRARAAALLAAAATIAAGPGDSSAARRQQPATGAPPGRVVTLRSVDALPAAVAASFREPIGWQQSEDGRDFVFDRRDHTVYRVDRRAGIAVRLVEVGSEPGRLLQPGAFAVAPDGTFAVADAPRGLERVQIFDADGVRLGGFSLPGRAMPRLAIGSLVLNGVASLQYTGRGILMSQPETGAALTVYGLAGTPVRSIGALRRTGHEDDRELHLALNSALPLVDPVGGGYYVVFLAGEPILRRYDRDGALLWERVVQGRELDPYLASLPTVWPRRTEAGREVPLVVPTVRTAAVDASGRVWISLMVPYTYVYDADGEKVRTVQFRAAGILAPSSLFFTRRGRILVTPGCYEFEAS